MCALAHVFNTQPDSLQLLLFSRALGSAKGDSQEEMGTHFSILAWRIPWTGGLRAAVHGVTGSWTRLSTHAGSFLGPSWACTQPYRTRTCRFPECVRS